MKRFKKVILKTQNGDEIGILFESIKNISWNEKVSIYQDYMRRSKYIGNFVIEFKIDKTATYDGRNIEADFDISDRLIKYQDIKSIIIVSDRVDREYIMPWKDTDDNTNCNQLQISTYQNGNLRIVIGG